MKAIKVFSNNAVSTVMPDGSDAILLGRGIGFNKRPGAQIDERRIEKVYYVQTEMQTKFLQMLQDVRPDVMAAAEQILALAQREGFYMSGQATLSLIDHISFAIERQEKGVTLPNLLRNETRLLYPKEYALGLRALEIIREQCGIALPDDEAGYVALHLVSLSVDRNAAYDVLKFVGSTLDLIQQIYGVALDPDSLDTMRMTTHLKFLAQRIQQGSTWHTDEDDMMYGYLLAKDPRHQLFLDGMERYVEKAFRHTLSKQERFYLLIHLTRILKIDE